MKSLLLLALACLALLCLPATARAEEDALFGAPMAQPLIAPDVGLRMETGYGIWYASGKDSSATLSRLTLAPEFTYRQRFTLAPMLRLTKTDIELLQKDGMTFDAALALPWQPSLGARTSFDAYQFWRLHLIVFGEFEFPLRGNRAWLAEFTPKGDIADLGLDVNVLRNHVTVDHHWRTAMAGLRIKGDFAWAHPYIEGGYLLIDSKLAVHFDETASTLLKDANLSPKRQFNAGSQTPYAMVGVHFDIGRGIQLRLNGTYLPSEKKSLTIGDLAVSFPIGSPP